MPVPLGEPPFSPAGYWDNTFLQEGKKMLYSSLLGILAPQLCTFVCLAGQGGEGEQNLLVLWK